MNGRTSLVLRTIGSIAVVCVSLVWQDSSVDTGTVSLTAYNPKLERHGRAMFHDGINQICLGEDEFDSFMQHSAMAINRCDQLAHVSDEILDEANNRAEHAALRKICRSAGALTCNGQLYGSATLMNVSIGETTKCLAIMPSHLFRRGGKFSTVHDCEFTGDYLYSKPVVTNACLLPTGSPVRKVSSGARFSLREADLANHFYYAGSDSELKDDIAVELDPAVCSNFDVPTYTEADLTAGLSEHCDLITAGSVQYVEFLDYNATGTLDGETILASDFIPHFNPRSKSPIVEHGFTTGSGTSGFMNYCFDKTTNAVRPLIMQFADKVRGHAAMGNAGELFLWDDRLDVHWGISVWGLLNRSIIQPTY